MPTRDDEPKSSVRDEQEWLAVELHDGLMQWIFSARMQVESLGKDLRNSEPSNEIGQHSRPNQLAATANETAREKVETIQKILNSALKEGRSLIGFLEGEAQQASAEKNWLGQLLNFMSLVEADAKIQQQELSIDANPDHWPTLNSHQAWNLLRIVQQAVMNSVQHAGPCSISVRSERLADGGFEVRVQDDGRGFDTEASVLPNHFGLASMQHRATLIDVEFEVVSQSDAGTTVRLRRAAS
ncbi:MAG: ATP-binding protein [Planctomycetota bacterium]